MSGALSARGVSRHYTVTIAELSYAFGETPPPSDSFLKSQAGLWQRRLGEVMHVVDRWLAAEEKAGRLAPSEVTTETVTVAAPGKAMAGGRLLYPALIELPACHVDERNMGVVVQLALPRLPGPEERSGLATRLCAAVKAAGPQLANPVDLWEVTELRETRDGLDMTLEAGFSVPVERRVVVEKARAELFKKAVEAMVGTAQRLVKKSPELVLHKPAGLGEGRIRFSLYGALGGFDLLTDVEGKKGKPAPDPVRIKDAFYEGWRAAGLPPQTNLQALLQPK